MSEQHIIARLREAGIAERDIPSTMRDVGMLILGRAMERILSTLPQDERERLGKLLPAEIEEYVKMRPELLGAIDQEKFDAIHDGTWNEYFAAQSGA